MYTFTGFLRRSLNAYTFAFIITIFSFTLSTLPAYFFVAEATSTLSGPVAHNVKSTSPYESGIIDASLYENLTFSFTFDSTSLDGDTPDSFTYGWRDASGDNDIATINGLPGSAAAEVDNIAVGLAVEAQVSDLEVYVYASTNSDNDQVKLTNVLVTGDLIEVSDDNIYGCMDPEAINYNSSATEQGDTLCDYPEPVEELESPQICSFAGSVIGYSDPAYKNDNGLVDANYRLWSAVSDGVAPYANFFGQEESNWLVNPFDFFSLGIDGYVVYEFTDKVAIDKSGDDIAIWEISDGAAEQQTEEKVNVSVSQNGIDFVFVKTIIGDGLIDISGTDLDFVKFVKLTDDSGGIHGPLGDGFDLDAITIIGNSCSEPVDSEDLEEDIYTISGRKYEVVGVLNNPFPTWTIIAENNDEAIKLSTTTDENGYYYFEVPAGNWELTEEERTDWKQLSVYQNGELVENNGYCNFIIPIYLSGYNCDFYNEFVGDDKDNQGESEELSDNNDSSNNNSGTRVKNKPRPQPLVLGAATSQCGLYLLDYLKIDHVNNPYEVRKLQYFLTGQGYYLPATGIFDFATDQAVRAFQLKYQDDILTPWVTAGYVAHNNPTGWVSQLTRWKINNIVCPGSQPLPVLIP